MTDRFRIAAFAGSLRRCSYNRGLLRAAADLVPAGVEIGIFDLMSIPLYNSDVEAEGDPEPVKKFKEYVHAADALLIAVPEYNYSVSGVLKNAIDWASRPAQTSVLKRKPVALVGASQGAQGTARAQLVLRQSFVFTECLVMPKPELYIPYATEHFDAEGNLKSESLRERLRGVVEGLVAWSRKIKAE